MKFTLPEDAFPALVLSPVQKEAFIREAQAVVHDTLVANEAFLAEGSKFPTTKWRLVRRKDGLSVYRERRTAANSRAPGQQKSTHLPSPSSQSSSWTTASDVSSFSSDDANASLMELPAMVLHGTVDGSLDECMFGAFAPTNEAWRWRSSHIGDRLDDSRILATIRLPTHDDPFQFLGIKWFAKENPAILSRLMQQRDYLVIEATGLTRDSAGEKVGYYLMHSISLSDVPELTELGIIRAKLSMCFIDRQKGTGKVEKYCRTFSEPGGRIPGRLAAAVGAEAIISASRIVDYAVVKKLTWFIKEKRQLQRERHQKTGSSRPKQCATCYKTFSTFASTAFCHICHHAMCTKCSVTKKMTIDVSSTGAVKQCALQFCIKCIMEAKEKSVWEMALSEVETASEISSISRSASAGFFVIETFSSTNSDGAHMIDPLSN